MRKYNLVMDGHFFMYRSIHTIEFDQYLRNGEKMLDTEKTKGIFIRKLAADIVHQIKKFFPLGIKRIIVTDECAVSWRKLYDPTYKGNRVKSDEINFTEFNNVRNILYAELGKHGVFISTSETAEGDDCATYWSQYSKNNGENCLLCSGDGDWKALVDNTETVHTIYYNPITMKFYGTSKFFDKIESIDDPEETDIFEINDSSVSLDSSDLHLKEILSNHDTAIIDSAEFSLTKIVMGDVADNIPKWIRGVGDKTYVDVLAEIKNHFGNITWPILKSIYDTPESIRVIIDIISKQKRIKIVDDLDVIEKRFRDNFRLSVLRLFNFPPELPILLNQQKKAAETHSKTTPLNFKKLLDMQEMLADTIYIDYDVEGSERTFGNSVEQYEKDNGII
jgi:hypothetical protein